MKNFFATIDNVNRIIASFYPDSKMKRLVFNHKNAKFFLKRLILIIDAIVKTENFSYLRNIFILEKDYWVNIDYIKSLERIALFIRKFDSLSLEISKTDRQTFIFIIDNVIEYIKQDRKKKKDNDKKKIFEEYRFWIENFFKLINQNILGEFEKSTIVIDNLLSGPIEVEVFYYKSSKVNFNLYPFVFKLDSEIYTISEINKIGVVYETVDKDKKIIINSSELNTELFNFMVLNLKFDEAERLKDKIKGTNYFIDAFNRISLALTYVKEKKYYKSYDLLNTIFAENMNHPLLYLFQIRNILYINKIDEVMIWLEKFIKRFPCYSEGYELFGDILLKDENYDLALVQYKKSLAIFQNKIISEKIKKCSSLIKEQELLKKNNKEENFFNINEEVKKNRIKAFFRIKEINQMIEILTSEYKNNIILVGESGVGKSFLIKYLTQKIVENDIPATLINKTVKEINFISLLTGSKYRGQFEERAVRVLQDLKGTKTILILEDIHLMMSSGGARGTSMDFVNILKPFLRDKTIQVIATTNNEEYKNTIERDNSLLGFFQTVTVNPLSEFETEEILSFHTGQSQMLQGVIISDNIIKDIVKSAKLNIRKRALPDSALMVLYRCVAKSKHKNLSSSDLFELEIDNRILSEVIADILNLSDSFTNLSMKDRLSNLQDSLSEKIKGQDRALEKIARSVTASKLGFDINDNRPDGVFLFIGPTGVGKTETAITLAKTLYGSEDNLIRLDMSEYMEKFTYSRFIGAAPGYVGYNDPNQLTDKVRQNPSSVILIDEVEKGDRELLNIFLQIFDAGRLTDARGNVIDFSNTTIIMTSNIGTNLYSKNQLGYQNDLNKKIVSGNSLNKSLKKYFSPEFLNRIDSIIVFEQLDKNSVAEIVKNQLNIIEEKLRKAGKEFIVEESVINYIVKKGYSNEYGARNISREIKNIVLEKLAILSLLEEWEYYDTILCQTIGEEVKLSLYNSGISIENKAMEDIDKMESVNA